MALTTPAGAAGQGGHHGHQRGPGELPAGGRTAIIFGGVGLETSRMPGCGCHPRGGGWVLGQLREQRLGCATQIRQRDHLQYLPGAEDGAGHAPRRS